MRSSGSSGIFGRLLASLTPGRVAVLLVVASVAVVVVAVRADQEREPGSASSGSGEGTSAEAPGGEASAPADAASASPSAGSVAPDGSSEHHDTGSSADHEPGAVASYEEGATPHADIEEYEEGRHENYDGEYHGDTARSSAEPGLGYDPDSATAGAQAPLFATGEVSVSRSALDLLTAAGVPPRLLVERHVSGDSGLVEGKAARENLQAAQTGYRVLSRYGVGEDGEEVWIVTDKTRTRTMVFDPKEYGVPGGRR